MPRRSRDNLPLKSVWDEHLLSSDLLSEKHRNKLWVSLIHQKQDELISDISMSNLGIPSVSREKISKEYKKFTTRVAERFESARGDTTKLLVELQDGHRVETVIMRHKGHATVCISSQIGCQMGCKFCATGTMGIIGDLTSGEIIEQLVHANSVTKVRNVVFMGMGEPLNNYENVKLAVDFMIDSRRFGLAARHITVSTVGVVKSMHRMTMDMPTVNLALSLHAPNQDVRVRIVPAATAHKIDKLMEAVDRHIAARKQKYFEQKPQNVDGENEKEKFNRHDSCVMIEYILIKDINDLEQHAHELAQLLLPRKFDVMLNLIPYNPTDVGEKFDPPTQESVDRFSGILKSYEIFTRVRREMGQDIAGACGQLALVKVGDSNEVIVAKIDDIEDVVKRVKFSPSTKSSPRSSSNPRKDKFSENSFSLSNFFHSTQGKAIIFTSFAILAGFIIMQRRKKV